jgi:hypothetical protein
MPAPKKILLAYAISTSWSAEQKSGLNRCISPSVTCAAPRARATRQTCSNGVSQPSSMRYDSRRGVVPAPRQTSRIVRVDAFPYQPAATPLPEILTAGMATAQPAAPKAMLVRSDVFAMSFRFIAVLSSLLCMHMLFISELIDKIRYRRILRNITVWSQNIAKKPVSPLVIDLCILLTVHVVVLFQHRRAAKDLSLSKGLRLSNGVRLSAFRPFTAKGKCGNATSSFTYSRLRRTGFS